MGPDSGRRGLFGALPFVLPQGSTDLFGAGSASAWRTFPQPGVGMRSSASSRPEIGQVKTGHKCLRALREAAWSNWSYHWDMSGYRISSFVGTN